MMKLIRIVVFAIVYAYRKGMVPRVVFGGFELL